MPRSLFTSEPRRRLISGPIILCGIFQAFDFFTALEFFPLKVINIINAYNQNKTKVANEKKSIHHAQMIEIYNEGLIAGVGYISVEISLLQVLK